MKQYIVDAFTDTPFKGNPAAVCILDMWPEDTWMLNMAFENNLSETAFLVRQDKSWRLRYFTPATKVDLCGHATLASAFVLMNIFPEKEDSVEFITNKDSLKVKRAGDLYAMDFPIVSQLPVPISFAMKDAFGIMPVKAFLVMILCAFLRMKNRCII